MLGSSEIPSPTTKYGSRVPGQIMQNHQKNNTVIIPIASFLIGSFFGAVLSYFVWPELMKSIDVRLFGNAEVVVNINELKMLQENQHLEDISILFGTSNGVGWITAVKVGHKDLNRLFGEALVPDDFGKLGNLEYNVTIINLGKRKAKNVRLSFSGSVLETNQKKDATPNINFINCGGFGEQYSCDAKINNLKKGERAGFFVRAETSSVHDIKCTVESAGDCSINHRSFYVKKVTEKEQLGIKLDGKAISLLPPINELSTPVLFRYKPQDNKWIPTDKISLQFILAKEGIDFDISTIPDDVIINNYVIDKSDPLVGTQVIIEHSE